MRYLHLFRVASILSLLLMVLPAQAGSWSIKYSSKGQYMWWNRTDGTIHTQPWPSDTFPETIGGDLDVASVGKITMTLTWIPDGSNDPAPQTVSFREWYAASSSGDIKQKPYTGTTDDGQGDPENVNYVNLSSGFSYKADSQGNRYVQVDSSSGTIVRTCSLSAYAPGDFFIYYSGGHYFFSQTQATVYFGVSEITSDEQIYPLKVKIEYFGAEKGDTNTAGTGGSPQGSTPCDIGNGGLQRRQPQSLPENFVKLTGTYAGQRMAVSWPGKGPLYYLTKLQIFFNGEFVGEKEANYQLQGKIGFNFDSTHYSKRTAPGYTEQNGAPILTTIVATTTSKDPKFHIQSYSYHNYAYNYAYLAANQTNLWSIRAVNNNKIDVSDMHHGFMVTASDHKSDILNNLISPTVFYIGTHGNGESFLDCFGHPDGTGGLASGERVTASEVFAAVIKKAEFKKPAYNFVFIDGCNTSSSNSLPSAFDLFGWKDCSYLGFTNTTPNQPYMSKWSAKFFENFKKGQTLVKAVNNTYEYFKDAKPTKENLALHNVVPLELGDVNNMTLFNGLYGGGLGTWHKLMTEDELNH